ncbi:MAG: hypothetical protein JW958_05425 [Candidatus Eisenbacteria bacterium]|nr:hypothetical protein [Candidatus Eisenbacteria bacterium]
MKRLASVFLALAVLAGLVSAETRYLSSDRYVSVEGLQSAERLPARIAEAHAAEKALRTDPTACPDSFDVVHYELHMTVNHSAELLDGQAFVTLQSMKDDLASVRLDLRSLTVSGVYHGGTPLAYTHAADTLLVTLDSPLDDGDTATVEVVYGGTPWHEPSPGGFGGFWVYGYPITDFSMGVGVSSGNPSMGRTWFPGVDSPCDKATCDIYVETAATKVGVATGELVSVETDTATGRKTYHWREDHPVSSYLMAVSIAKYDEVTDAYHDFIHHYVHRDLIPNAPGSFQNVHHMMDGLIERFGDYPYDEFGYVTTPIGDMEHQTKVFHISWGVNGTTTYDDLLAHEMTHQWFGDLVTYGDWRDVWLSEGFATYGQALFHEHLYGEQDYHDYVVSDLFTPYLNSAEILTYPIYDPDYLWGTVAYEKGASVVHMLRGVMGDSLFFDALNLYLDNHAYGNAYTPDFIADCETVYGGDLDWFFDEWIYQGGHPVIDWGWTSVEETPGNWRVDISTRQTQTVGPDAYVMPVDFLIETPAGDTTVVLWIDAETNQFQVYPGGEATAVLFDPDEWLLDENAEVSTAAGEGAPPARFALEPNRPNPFNPITSISFELPEACPVTIGVYAITGERIHTLVDGISFPEGRHAVVWDGRDDAGRAVASGVYFCRIDAGGRTESRKMSLIR